MNRQEMIVAAEILEAIREQRIVDATRILRTQTGNHFNWAAGQVDRIRGIADVDRESEILRLLEEWM